MKSYQIQVEDHLFPELKKVLGFLPKGGVKLFNQNGGEIQVDSDDFELSNEMKTFIDEGIASLERGESFTTNEMLMEATVKYPNLKINSENR